MEETFKKFCIYFITDGPKDTLDELKKITGKNFNDYKKKTYKFVKNLKRKTAKLGFGIDFESFCALLEKYIAIKDNLTDEEKKIYLKNLIELSQIYDINLREELEQYVTVKESKSSKERELFERMCIYNLRTETNVSEYNELKEFASKNELDFNETQKNSLMFTEEIKLSAEKLGFDATKEALHPMIDDYLAKKKNMTDNEKADYLKVLFYLSVTFNVNLRKELTKEQIIKINKLPTDINKKILKEQLTSPLEDEEVIEAFFKQKINDDKFDIANLLLITDKEINDNKEYDYLKLQADLTYKLYTIFLDKFNNYAYNDLNSKYLNLITEEELSRLETLTREEIYNILKEIEKGEQSHYICKRYNLTDNLYTFILLSTVETTDIKVEHIGIGDNSLFINNNFKNNYCIYLNGPKLETNLLLNEYIRQCVENNLNYDMKALSNNKKAKTIIYANKEDLIKKINILNQINNNHPEITAKMSIPMYLTATLDNSYYSISNIGTLDDTANLILPYSDYINEIAEVSYYRVLAKLIVSKLKETSKQQILIDFISLDNIKLKEDKSVLNAKYNNIDFINIKELINQYSELLNKVLKISLNDEKKSSELLEEFTKSIKYINNIIQNKPRTIKTNLAIEVK